MPSYEWIKAHKEIILLEERIKMLENNVKELQAQLQNSYKRIGELHNLRNIPV